MLVNLDLKKPNKITGESRHFRDAVYACLLHIKPTYCLEIGTHLGQTSSIFQQYFEEHCPHGLLVTVDIKKYVDLNMENVKQCDVWPHVLNSNELHLVKNEELLHGFEQAILDSHKRNVNIIRQVCATPFDFCFLDGDHQAESVYKDFAIARELLAAPKYILFDDTEDKNHDTKTIYEEEILQEERLNVYDFSNWGVNVGAALIWDKE